MGNLTRINESTQSVPYKYKDMSLADWDRQEIELAKAEMLGLIALREEYGVSKPLAGTLQIIR